MRCHIFTIPCVISVLFLALVGCSSTELIESPKTAYVPKNVEAKTPQVIWSSRALNRRFDYLGRINVRSWSYDGAVERLVEGGRELKADAIVDIHFERVGFMKRMQAFAIKFKE